MKRDFVKKASVKVCIFWLLCFSISLAEVQVETNNLSFKFSDTSAFIMNTVTSSSAQIAEVYFSIKYDSTWSGTLQTAVLEFTFDSTELQFTGAEPVGAWTGGSIDTTRVDLGHYDLQFYNGNVTSFPSTYTNYAKLKFKIKCQPELSVDSVLFDRTPSESHITLGGTNYSPDSDNWDDGTVTASDMRSVFSLRDTTFSNSCQKVVNIPVYDSSNFKTYAIKHWIKYNEDKLHFEGAVNEGFAFNIGIDSSKTDTAIVTLWKITGVSEINDVPVYSLQFKLLSDVQDDTAKVGFYSDSSLLLPFGCTSYDIGETYSQASTISLTDSAIIKGTYVYPGTSLQKGDNGDSLIFHLMIKNTFMAGSAGTDSGIFINVNTRKHLDLDEISSLQQDVEFAHAVSDSFVSICQFYDGGGSNYVGVNNITYDTLLRLKMEFSESGFTPNWNNKYLKPKFINNFGGSKGPTLIEDTLACVQADSSNGKLRFWGSDTFDSVLVDMGQFYTNGHVSTSACTYNDLYVRSTVAIDSFSAKVTVNSTNCIYDIIDELTGVVATKVNYYTWRIYTNGDFEGLEPGESLTKICRVEAGHKTGCGGATHSVTMGLALDSARMWDVSDEEQFVALDVTSGTAKCGVAIMPCADCIEGGGSKIGEDVALPKEFMLHQNYPNPFNPVTTISFDLPIEVDYVLTIYNVLGQEVKSFEGRGEPGTVRVEWDASGNSSGLYLYRLDAGDYTARKKMLLIK